MPKISSRSILFKHVILLLLLLPTMSCLVACVPVTNQAEVLPVTAQPVEATTNSAGNGPILATWTPLPTIQPRPDFVIAVAPPESISIPHVIYQYQRPGYTTFGLVDVEDAWSVGYRSEICADIDLGKLVQPGDHFGLDRETAKRFRLIIDGREVAADLGHGLGGAVLVTDSSTEPVMSWEAYSRFCWIVPLPPGTHEITLQFQQTSGDIQEYSWQIALTTELPPEIRATAILNASDLPVPLPLEEPWPTTAVKPPFIQTVLPEPRDVIPLSYFNNELCVEVKYEALFSHEPYNTNFFNNNLKAYINGSSIAAAQSATILVDNATPKASIPTAVISQLITAGEDGQERITTLRKCWQNVTLLPGRYEAHVIWNAAFDDPLEYKWQFAITDK